MDERLDFLVTWQNGKEEKLELTQHQADNFKEIPFVVSVELIK